MLLSMKPTIIGDETTPESVALICMTACANNGKNNVAPNMPALAKNIATIETEKMLFLNKLGLMIGSATRCSIQKNTMHITTEKISKPMICGESQAYSLPAHENASNNGTDAKTNTTAPR